MAGERGEEPKDKHLETTSGCSAALHRTSSDETSPKQRRDEPPAVAVLQATFTSLPPLQRISDTEAAPIHVWPWLQGGALLFVPVAKAERALIRLKRGALASTACVAP